MPADNSPERMAELRKLAAVAPRKPRCQTTDEIRKMRAAERRAASLRKIVHPKEKRPPKGEAHMAKMREARARSQAAKKAAASAPPPPTPAVAAPAVVQTGEVVQRAEGIEAYGVLWPPQATPMSIEAALYTSDVTRRHVPGALPKHQHFVRFLKHLVPEQVFAWHRWAYEGAELWCEDGWTTIGAAGTGKSAMFGLFALGDWLADPANTITVLVSTSLDSLKARIWKYVCQWYDAMPIWARAGKFRQANPLGLLYVADPTDEHPDPQWLGAGIVCVGFKAGDKDESIKNHLGRHLPRNRIIIDELQGVNRAVLDIWWNMGASGNFKFGGFGNPQSMFDPLAEASVPHGHASPLSAFDWLHTTMMDSGSRRTKSWKTKMGRCLMFDGLDSPALDDKRFHYLIGPGHIERARASGGENSALWYTFIRGIFPPSGGLHTLLSAREITEAGADKAGVAWDGQWQEWLWGDLAHGGEDDAEVQRIRVGKAVGGGTIIELHERTIIQVDLKAGLISQQIGRAVAQIAREHGIPAARIAMDATATQGAIIDAIEIAMKEQGIVRIHASGPPSKGVPVKLGWPQTCDEAYDNRAAELAGNFREFVLAGQIRGIDQKLAQQASSRVILPLADTGGKLKLDPDKKAGNGGRSPNALDLVCVGCTALRERAEIHPGSGTAPAISQAGMDQWADKARTRDIRSRGRLRNLVASY